MSANRSLSLIWFFVSFSVAPACEDIGGDFGEGASGVGLVGESGQGLKGAYFNNQDFTDKVLERVDSMVDFEWGRGSPDSKVGSDTFSVRWTGFVEAKYSETYTFYTVGDDGIRLYVDGKLVVSDWSNHGARERSGTISLEAGQLTPIKLEYYEDGGGAVAKLFWSSRSQTKQVIPQTQLFQTQNQDDTGGGGEVTNVALGKPTRQSTTAYRGESSRAVDGNTSGRYGDNSVTHTNFEAGAWWQVDLGAAHQVERVVLFNRTDCCGQRLSNFNVDYLDASGKVIATRNYPGQAQAQTEIALAGSGVYFVRVQLKGTDALSLAEVQVFGTPGAGGGGDADCVQVNEGQTASLSCAAGKKIASIDFAAYGMPEGSCDAGFKMGTCHASTSQKKVEDACLNKTSCAVAASNSVFGDPCAGKFKRLAIVYTCGSGTAVEDLCPADPNKTKPGICGCGTPDVDSNKNGVYDCNEDDDDGDGGVTGGGSFSLAVLPDLQKVTRSGDNAAKLYEVADFIVGKKREYNVKAVLDVGDIVQVAKIDEHQSRWDRMLKAAHLLHDEGLPFIPACGNHDGCDAHYGSVSDYNAQFAGIPGLGSARREEADQTPYLVYDNPYFQDNFSLSAGDDGVENAYYEIEHSGRKFIVLSLRYNSNRSQLDAMWDRWAHGVLERNSDKEAIILTHEFHASHIENMCRHENVFLAIQGHRHGSRTRNIIDCGGGHKIEKYIFAFAHGGEDDKYDLDAAAARFYTFDLDGGRVCHKTYSVRYGRWLTETKSCDPNVDSGHCDEFCFDHDFMN